MKITGTFSVKMQPEALSIQAEEGMQLARISLDKTFEGELNAHSMGEMLSAVTSKPGSAGYVAIEQVIGSLSGKSGSFVLQHYGLMHQGENHLTLTVVPDSGTGELIGLSGSMDIRIEDGQHYYDFDYVLG